jgi:hypothetical protein
MTIVLLVVMSILGYTVSTQVATQRHRTDYFVNYTQAQYACDSALKCALTTFESFAPELISRPNEPDFTDLFQLDQEGLDLFIEQFVEEWLQTADDLNDVEWMLPGQVSKALDPFSDGNDAGLVTDSAFLPANVKIRGPYGAEWPLTQPPIVLDVGATEVTIEIHDENAKYPLGWMLISDEESRPELEAGFKVFCEWMAIDQTEIEALAEQLAIVGEIKPFALEFKAKSAAPKTTPSTASRVAALRKTSSRTAGRTVTRRRIISPADQKQQQDVDLARLMSSNLIDREVLARTTVEAGTRKESALKYIGPYATDKVNINTAPRQVLEAVLVMGAGSDAVAMAEEIRIRRREKPFTDFAELKKDLVQYTDSLDKCEKYVSTVSTVFSVKVTAKSGMASASKIAVVAKQGKGLKPVIVLSD